MENIMDPKTVNFMSDISREQTKRKKLTMYEHEGVYFSDLNVSMDTLNKMPGFEARKDDVYIVTYPKAGTTWAQEIMYLALNDGDTTKAKQSHTMIRIPYIEANIQPPKFEWTNHPLRSLIHLWYMLLIMFKMLLRGYFKPPTPYEMITTLPSPRFLKSHLPDHLLPPDIFKKKSKIVYVARNPKDLAVSYYHFSQLQPMLPSYGSWDKFIEDFMVGKVTYGKWYDHYLGFWKRRHEDNILFLKYEDMKKDDKAAVKQISEFLGYNYSDDILDRITEYCTFTNMKKNPMTNPDRMVIGEKQKTGESFMRKGKIGDWKNYFTDAQNEAFNALYDEKLAGTGLEFDFE